MNAQTFLMSVGSALISIIIPKCKGVMESSIVGSFIFGKIYQALRYVGEHEKELKEAGMLDKDGNVDIELASFAIYHGVQWPIKVGPFIFKQEDWSEIVNMIQPKVCNAEVVK